MSLTLGKEHIDTMLLLRLQMERCAVLLKKFSEGQRVDTYSNADGLTELHNKLHEIRRDSVRLKKMLGYRA